MPQKKTIEKAKEQAATFRQRMAKRQDERGLADEQAFLQRCRARRPRTIPPPVK